MSVLGARPVRCPSKQNGSEGSFGLLQSLNTEDSRATRPLFKIPNKKSSQFHLQQFVPNFQLKVT